MNQHGCSTNVLAVCVLLLIGAVASCFWGGGDQGAERRGPIPVTFQGTYSSMGCEGLARNIDGVVTVSGTSVRFGGGTFTATERLSESDRSVRVRGYFGSAAGREDRVGYTITLSEDGRTADLNGYTYDRCSSR